MDANGTKVKKANRSLHGFSGGGKAEKQKSSIKPVLGRAFPVLVLIGLSIVLQIGSKGILFSLSNITTMISSIFPMLVAAMGALFVYAHGGIDLSVGSLYGLAMLETLIIFGDEPVLSAGKVALIIAVTVATGIGVGLANGLLISKLRLQPLITTLCMNYILRGIVTAICESRNTYGPAGMSQFDSTAFKLIVVILAVGAVIFVFEKTRYGKQLKAIGGSEIAARQAGIRVDLNKISAYVLAGAFAAVAGAIQVIRTSMVRANSGSGFEIDIFLAILLGGVPLSGGAKVKSWCAVIGCATLVILESGLMLWGLMPEQVTICKGLIFIGMVAFTFERKRGEVIS